MFSIYSSLTFVFNLENIYIFQIVVVGRAHSITPLLSVRHLESGGGGGGSSHMRRSKDACRKI